MQTIQKEAIINGKKVTLDMLVFNASPVLGTCKVIKFYPPNKIGGRKYDYRIEDLKMGSSSGALKLHGIGISNSKVIGNNIYVGNNKICSIEQMKDMFIHVKEQFEK